MGIRDSETVGEGSGSLYLAGVLCSCLLMRRKRIRLTTPGCELFEATAPERGRDLARQGKLLRRAPRGAAALTQRSRCTSMGAVGRATTPRRVPLRTLARPQFQRGGTSAGSSEAPPPTRWPSRVRADTNIAQPPKKGNRWTGRQSQARA